MLNLYGWSTGASEVVEEFSIIAWSIVLEVKSYLHGSSAGASEVVEGIFILVGSFVLDVTSYLHVWSMSGLLRS